MRFLTRDGQDFEDSIARAVQGFEVGGRLEKAQLRALWGTEQVCAQGYARFVQA
jgi:hypothetical protein